MRKLGILPPDATLPGVFYQSLNHMWANNGDAISLQYAGTAAMKVHLLLILAHLSGITIA